MTIIIVLCDNIIIQQSDMFIGSPDPSWHLPDPA